MVLCMAANTMHIVGKANGNCDRLSRRWDRGEAPVMSVSEEADDMGVGGGEVLEMSTVSVRGIIELCDPRTLMDSESEFIAIWVKARSAIDIFILV
jgi:hypothetical protein